MERFAYLISSPEIVWETSRQRLKQAEYCPCTSMTTGESGAWKQVLCCIVCTPASRFSCLLSFSPSFSILVNSASSVKLFQFAKVFWDYEESSEGGRGDVSEKPAASLRKLPLTCVGADHMAQVASSSQKMHDCNSKKSERAHHTWFPPAKCPAQGRHAQVY